MMPGPQRKFPPQAAAARMETLEPRQMLSALTVTTAWADNRGLAELRFSAAVNVASLRAGVGAYTAGKDGKFGTRDDLRQKLTLTYRSKRRTLDIQLSKLPADTPYLIRLNGLQVKATDGARLSGTFSGKFPSTGKPGTNFTVIARKRTGNPVARFITNMGTMDVSLYKDDVSTTVTNFLAYANAGRYDSSIIHRKSSLKKEKIAVIQGGGFLTKKDSNGYPLGIKTFAAIPLQPRLSNLAGTIAVARGADPNSGTSQWYFNVANNRILNHRATNDGYAVFGKITNAAGLKVLKAIYALNTVSLTPNDTKTAVTTVPVVTAEPLTFVVVTRISILDTVVTS